jgi:hypothetical protein
MTEDTTRRRRKEIAELLASPALHSLAAPKPTCGTVALLLDEARGDFTGGFIRYEQHGTGAR